MIYLDNAATTFPKPRGVSREMGRVMKKFCANPGRSGHKMSLLSSQVIYALREKAAEKFYLPELENVILTKNSTEGLNFVIKGLVSPGDRILISSMEHNSVLRPAKNREKEGAALDIFTVDPENDEITLANFKEKLKKGPKLVACVQVSNVFGNILPVREMARLSKEAGAEFLLDASQSAGILPIDITSEGYSFVCCPGHKGLYGPQGTGLLLINSKQKLCEVTSGGTGSLSKEETQPEMYPDFLESGTLNTPGAAGLTKGLFFLDRFSEGEILERETALSKLAIELLSEIEGVKIYAPGKNRCGLFSFQMEGIDCETIATLLDKENIAVRSGLHCSPLSHQTMGTSKEGAVRVSFSVFNTEKEVFALAKSVGKIRRTRAPDGEK